MPGVTLEGTILKLLEEKKYFALRDILTAMNPADVAYVFSKINENRLPLLFRLLPKDIAAETFTFMDGDAQELLIRGFSDNELKEVFDELYIDDAVDIVEEMPANVVKRILQNTDPEKRLMINEILKYPEDSAGSLMAIEYISLRPDMTVAEAIKRIRRTITEKEIIYTCYVTDDNRKLLGYLSVRRLLLSGQDEIIGEIMDSSPISVHTLDDKEDVAKSMAKYDFVTMPVVDDEYRLVGIVTFDDALDVMQDETTEDIESMAAVIPNDDTYFSTSDISHASHRIVWLMILMLSATLTEGILTRCNKAFSALPILVSFIPMIMDTSGNCGSQSCTTIIRAMSIEQIRLRDYFKVVFTEFRISLVVGIILSLVNGLRIFLMYDYNIQLALSVSLSIVSVVILAQFIGSSLPMLAKRLGLDPAVMAAPLITTILDACSMLIFFTISIHICGL